ASDQHRVTDAAACVGIGPVDQREPEDDQEQDHQLHREVDGVVGDTEYSKCKHRSGECSGRGGKYALNRQDPAVFYRNRRPKAYPMPKKTRMTMATISATSPIMVRKLGRSSRGFTASRPCGGRRAPAGRRPGR